MYVEIKLSRLVCLEEADGWGEAEPYLWPIFFKIDDDTIDSVGRFLREHVDDREICESEEACDFGPLLNAILERPDERVRPISAWLHAPGGRHGNLGGSIDAGESRRIPADVGTWRAQLRADVFTKLGDDSGTPPQIGCIAVLLEEDTIPPTADIVDAYENTLIPRVIEELRGRVQRELLAAAGINDDEGSGDDEGDSNQEVSLAREIARGFDDAIPAIAAGFNRDDVVGVAIFTVSANSLLGGVVVTDSRTFRESEHSEDGDYRLELEVREVSGAGILERGVTAYTYQADDTQHVIYTGTDERIREMWFARGRWWQQAIPEPVIRSRKPKGLLTGYEWTVDDTQHIVYRDDAGDIIELWFELGRGWRRANLTQAANAPAAASSPNGYTWSGDDTQHVIYRGQDGHVHELWFARGGGWQHNDITAASGAPECVGRPAGVGGLDRQYVCHRDADGHVILLTFQRGRGWRSENLHRTTGFASEATSDLSIDAHRMLRRGANRTDLVGIAFTDQEAQVNLLRKDHEQWRAFPTTRLGLGGMVAYNRHSVPSVLARTNHVMVGYRNHLSDLSIILERRNIDLVDDRHWYHGFMHNLARDQTLRLGKSMATDPKLYYWDVDHTYHASFLDYNGEPFEFWCRTDQVAEDDGWGIARLIPLG